MMIFSPHSRRRDTGRPGIRAAALAAVVLTVGAVPGPVMASTSDAAAVLDVALEVTADGRGHFTATDDLGGDSGPTNGVVRTNDSITYRATVSATGGTVAAPRLRVDASEGTAWAGLPSTCVEGSTVAARRLDCVLPGLPEGQVRAVPLVLDVDDSRVDGDRVAVEASASASDDGVVAVSATAPPVRVSAAARYDLAVDVVPAMQHPDVVGPDGSRGVVVTYPVAVTWRPLVPEHGVLGHERATGALSFDVDVSQFRGDLPSGAVLWPEVDGRACGQNGATLFRAIPAGSGGGPRAVADSGVVSCTQADAGAPVHVELDGVDTAVSAGSTPTLGADGGPLSGGPAVWVASAWVSVWVPTPPSSDSVLSTVRYTPVQVTAAGPNDAVAEPLANNVTARTLGGSGRGGGYKYLHRLAADGTTWKPGSSKSGDPFATPGQVFRAQVTLGNEGDGPLPGAVVCDVFDPTTQRLVRHGGRWATFWGDWGAGQRLEYAAFTPGTPTEARDATCGDDHGWRSSPEDVPGGVAAVGMVRVVGEVPTGSGGNLYVPLQVLENEKGTRVSDFGQLGFGPAADDRWQHDTSPAENGHGPLADSVVVTPNLARVGLDIVDPAPDPDPTSAPAVDPDPVPSGPSFVSVGDSVDVVVSPSLTNASGDRVPDDVEVGLTLSVGALWDGTTASVPPTTVELVTTPEGERQRVSWRVADAVPNESLPPLRLRVVFSEATVDGPAEQVATVSAVSDLSAERLRRAARSVQVVSAGGLRLTTSAVDPSVPVGDPAEWRLEVANTDDEPLTQVDLVDVLPVSGLDGSRFGGRARLTAEVVLDPRAIATVTYTDAPEEALATWSTSADVLDGALRWCSVELFGSAGCPSGLADVTAVRVTHGSPLAPGDAVTHHLAAEPSSGADGDVLVDRFRARTPDLALPAVSNPAPVTLWQDDPGVPPGPDEPGAPRPPVDADGTSPVAPKSLAFTGALPWLLAGLATAGGVIALGAVATRRRRGSTS